jgi:hypothetical protein
MPRMLDLSDIEVLFFKAEKNYYQPIDRRLVDGYPFFNNTRISYKPFQRDFFFRTYKEVIVAGICWTKQLFGASSISNLKIKHLEFGRKKQWFNTQLVFADNGVRIDGEQYNPFVNIAYSYDVVTKVKFEIGFYRYACSNGLIRDINELMKMDIKPETLFEIPFWINPCLVKFLTKRFEYEIQVLKRTRMQAELMMKWVKKYLPKWNIKEDFIYKYCKELGENGYALLNILTDIASNNPTHELDFDHQEPIFSDQDGFDFLNQDRSSYSERASRQRRIGIFLDRLIKEIEAVNEIKPHSVDVNSPKFRLNDHDLNHLESIQMPPVFQFDLNRFSFDLS